MYIVQIHSPTQHQYSLSSISLTQSDCISIEKITNPPYSKNAATTEIHQMQWSTAAHHMEASACKPLLQTWHIPTQSITLITMQHQPPTKPSTHHYLMGRMLSRDRNLILEDVTTSLPHLYPMQWIPSTRKYHVMFKGDCP